MTWAWTLDSGATVALYRKGIIMSNPIAYRVRTPPTAAAATASHLSTLCSGVRSFGGRSVGIAAAALLPHTHTRAQWKMPIKITKLEPFVLRASDSDGASSSIDFHHHPLLLLLFVLLLRAGAIRRRHHHPVVCEYVYSSRRRRNSLTNTVTL